MFARPSSSAYVCFRCHLRLTRQNPNALSSILPQRSPFSVSCLRPFYSSPRSQWTDPLGQTDDHDEGDSRTRRRDRYYHPLGKLRGKKGGQVRENAEALSVNTLGVPAEVIVLRDAPHNDLEETVEQEDAEEGNGAALGSSRRAILDAIQGEDVIMDQETVNQQIDALRPRVEDPNSGRLILPAKEYFRLCQVLTDSYSRPQLDAYMARSKEAVPIPSIGSVSLETRQKSLESKDSEIQFRPWKAVSKADRIQKHLSTADTNNSRRIKRSRLASTLLKHCWKVEIAEEVERLGDLICTLPRAGIRLLTVGKPSYLDEIAENRQAKIEVDGLNVRIVADKDSAIYVLEDINRLWSLRHTEQFRLVMPTSSSTQPSSKDKLSPILAFRPEDVALASSLTRTTMTYANNSKKTAVAIDGVGKESVEDATRALLALVDIPTKHSSWTVLVLPENNTDIVLQEISDLDAIPYRDRRTSYGRFYSQVNRAQPEALILEDGPDYTEPAKERSKPATNIGDQESGPKMATTSALDNDHFNAFLKEFLGNGQKQPPAHKHLTDDKFWSAAVESCVSVSLGLVIHPKSAEVASRIRHIPLEGSDDAVFLHRIPGLLQVLPHLIWNREKVIDVLSFRLLHNPWKQPGPAFPEIRLDFEINSLNEDERSAEFKGLYALTKDRSGQVMLPSQVVDLCFKRKKIFQAKLDNLENQPDVKQFIEQTKANILDGSGRLRAPGSVLIHVPFAVAELTTSMRKNSPKNAPPSKPTRVGAKVQYTLPEVANKTGILAHYHFIGVEHLQIAGYTFEGYPVRYTSVEAGKLGGKYGNLEILMPTPDPAEKYSKERASAQRIAFAKTSLKLVHLVDQAAHGKLERPGPVVQPAKADEETDQEGMERWTPEYLNQTAMQTSTGHEDEVDGTEERPGGELSETVGHHTTIATRTDAAISSRAEGDASSEAPPAAKGEETIQPIESASDEYPPGRGQSTIPLDTTEHEEDWESAEPKQRAAASG